MDIIPKVLQNVNRWINHNEKKVPVDAAGYPINPFKAKNLLSFQQARKQPRIGFVLGDGFVGIDIDAPKTSQQAPVFNADGTPMPWAQNIIDHLGSYTERSVSKRGIHILGYCNRYKGPTGKIEMTLPSGLHPNIEVYKDKQYFVVTSDPLGDPFGSPPGSNDISDFGKPLCDFLENPSTVIPGARKEPIPGHMPKHGQDSPLQDRAGYYAWSRRNMDTYTPDETGYYMNVCQGHNQDGHNVPLVQVPSVRVPYGGNGSHTPNCNVRGATEPPTPSPPPLRATYNTSARETPCISEQLHSETVAKLLQTNSTFSSRTLSEHASSTMIDLFREVYGIVVPDDGKNHLFLCPWHDDSSPSLSIHARRGFYCHGCGRKGGVGALRLLTGICRRSPEGEQRKEAAASLEAKTAGKTRGCQTGVGVFVVPYGVKAIPFRCDDPLCKLHGVKNMLDQGEAIMTGVRSNGEVHMETIPDTEAARKGYRKRLRSVCRQIGKVPIYKGIRTKAGITVFSNTLMQTTSRTLRKSALKIICHTILAQQKTRGVPRFWGSPRIRMSPVPRKLLEGVSVGVMSRLDYRRAVLLLSQLPDLCTEIKTTSGSAVHPGKYIEEEDITAIFFGNPEKLLKFFCEIIVFRILKPRIPDKSGIFVPTFPDLCLPACA